MMIKKNKGKLLVSSIIILLPVLVGMLLWDKLPDMIATHWNAEGQADGWSSKLGAVLYLPAFMLAVHWLCVIVTTLDPKNKNIDGKPLHLVLWICPAMSLLMAFVTYGTALGMHIGVETIMPLFMGVMFIVIGNYLPKCKQNYSLGIKVPWTLNDTENWNATHRFAGKIWTAGGVAVMVSVFWGTIWFMMVVLAVMAIVPAVYSYLYYRRNGEKETQ